MLRSASFRWLTGGFCLAFLANVAVTVHLIPYLTDHGFSSGFAATAAGLIGMLALPGRLIFTPLGGRIPRRFVAAGIFLFQTVGLIVARHDAHRRPASSSSSSSSASASARSPRRAPRSSPRCTGRGSTARSAASSPSSSPARARWRQ